jgi:glycosyltransferase involved in cell wall biosynthesis
VSLSAPRVAILTSSHPPFDTRVFTKEARSLAAAGFDVTLFAPHTEDVTIDGVKLHAIAKGSSRAERWLVVPWRVFRAARRLRPDVYHFHDPELFPIGVVLKLLGARVIADVHEDHAKDLMGKTYVPEWVKAPLAFVIGLAQHLAARMFDQVILAREDIRPTFRTHPRVEVISNYPELAGFGRPRTVQSPAPGRPFTLAYIGSINARRGLFEAMTAVAAVDRTHPCRFRVYGNCNPPSLLEEAKSRPEWRVVDWGGRVAYTELPDLVADADAGIVGFLPEPNHINSGPTKLFEYMALGLPVIASDFPEWRAVIDGNGCGICIDPEDPADITRAIERLIADPAAAARMGAAGRKAIEATYNWEVEAARLIAAYRAVLAR